MPGGAVKPRTIAHLPCERGEVDADLLDLFELDDGELGGGRSTRCVYAGEVDAVPGDTEEGVGHFVEQRPPLNDVFHLGAERVDVSHRGAFRLR